MMSLPTVSVITINRNMGDSVDRTILSVLSQQCPFQWIVIDGASTDASLPALRQAVRLGDTLISEPDRGVSDAFNKGIALASGESLIFMNSGDEFSSPHALSDLVNAWDYRHFKWATGTAEVVDEAGKTLFVRRVSPDQSPLALVKADCRIFHQATIMQRELFAKHGGFDLTYRMTMDHELWLRWIKADIVPQIIDQVVCRFRNGGVSSSPYARWQEACRARAQNGLSNPWFFDARLQGIVCLKYLMRPWVGGWAFRLKERLRW